MRKAEQKVWDGMKRAAKRHAPYMWLQRVENLVGDGMPDVYTCDKRLTTGGLKKSFCWVELKAANLPKRSTTKLKMSEGVRTSQVNWHMKAQTKGLDTFILLRVEEAMKEPLLIDGSLAGEVNSFTFDQAKTNAVAVGWEAIFRRLSA